MPDRINPEVVKPTPINIILTGIEQAKLMRAPLSVIRKLEDELVTHGINSMLQTQNHNNN